MASFNKYSVISGSCHGHASGKRVIKTTTSSPGAIGAQVNDDTLHRGRKQIVHRTAPYGDGHDLKRTLCVMSDKGRPLMRNGKKGKERRAAGAKRTWCFINTRTGRLCVDNAKNRKREIPVYRVLKRKVKHILRRLHNEDPNVMSYDDLIDWCLRRGYDLTVVRECLSSLIKRYGRKPDHRVVRSAVKFHNVTTWRELKRLMKHGFYTWTKPEGYLSETWFVKKDTYIARYCKGNESALVNAFLSEEDHDEVVDDDLSNDVVEATELPVVEYELVPLTDDEYDSECPESEDEDDGDDVSERTPMPHELNRVATPLYDAMVDVAEELESDDDYLSSAFSEIDFGADDGDNAPIPAALDAHDVTGFEDFVRSHAPSHGECSDNDDEVESPHEYLERMMGRPTPDVETPDAFLARITGRRLPSPEPVDRRMMDSLAEYNRGNYYDSDRGVESDRAPSDESDDDDPVVEVAQRKGLPGFGERKGETYTVAQAFDDLSSSSADEAEDEDSKMMELVDVSDTPGATNAFVSGWLEVAREVCSGWLMEDRECMICLNTTESHDYIERSCGCYVHESCHEQWTKISKRCTCGEVLEHRKCMICLADDTEDPDGWTKTACGHHFHGDCIRQWCDEENTCPLCKARIEEIDGERVHDSRQRVSAQAGLEWLDAMIASGGMGRQTGIVERARRAGRELEERMRALGGNIRVNAIEYRDGTVVRLDDDDETESDDDDEVQAPVISAPLYDYIMRDPDLANDFIEAMPAGQWDGAVMDEDAAHDIAEVRRAADAQILASMGRTHELTHTLERDNEGIAQVVVMGRRLQEPMYPRRDGNEVPEAIVQQFENGGYWLLGNVRGMTIVEASDRPDDERVDPMALEFDDMSEFEDRERSDDEDYVPTDDEDSDLRIVSNDEDSDLRIMAEYTRDLAWYNMREELIDRVAERELVHYWRRETYLELEEVFYYRRREEEIEECMGIMREVIEMEERSRSARLEALELNIVPDTFEGVHEVYEEVVSGWLVVEVEVDTFHGVVNVYEEPEVETAIDRMNALFERLHAEEEAEESEHEDGVPEFLVDISDDEDEADAVVDSDEIVGRGTLGGRRFGRTGGLNHTNTEVSDDEESDSDDELSSTFSELDFDDRVAKEMQEIMDASANDSNHGESESSAEESESEFDEKTKCCMEHYHALADEFDRIELEDGGIDFVNHPTTRMHAKRTRYAINVAEFEIADKIMDYRANRMHPPEEREPMGDLDNEIRELKELGLVDYSSEDSEESEEEESEEEHNSDDEFTRVLKARMDEMRANGELDLGVIDEEVAEDEVEARENNLERNYRLRMQRLGIENGEFVNRVEECSGWLYVYRTVMVSADSIENGDDDDSSDDDDDDDSGDDSDDNEVDKLSEVVNIGVNSSDISRGIDNSKKMATGGNTNNDDGEEKLMSELEVKDWMFRVYAPSLPTKAQAKGMVLKYDLYDPKMVDGILEREEEFMARDPEIYKPKVFNDLRKLKYAAIAPGITPVYYTKTREWVDTNDGSKHKIGRVYGIKGVGLAGLKKEVRNLVTRYHYMDVDIKNCHPVLISLICKENGWACPRLMEYIKNREEVLKQVHRDRERAKNLVLMTIYGMAGGWRSYSDHSFVYKFGLELDGIKNKMKATYPCISLLEEKLTGEKKNPFESAISLYVQEKEHEVLMMVMGLFKDKNVIEGDFTTLMFDGLYVPNKPNTLDVLDEVNRELKSKYGEDMELAIKSGEESDLFDREGYWEMMKWYNETRLEQLMIMKMGKYKSGMVRFVIPSSEREENKIPDEMVDHMLYGDRLDTDVMQPIYDNDSIFVVARMGSGKTYQLCKYLESHPCLKVVMVTFRRSLGKKYKEDLNGFTYYEDVEGGLDCDKYPRLIVQIDSFDRVLGGYDVLVLDEASYTLDRLYGECKACIIPKLVEYIENVPKVMVLDAYLARQHIEYVTHNRKNKKNVVVRLKSNANQGNVKIYGDDKVMLNDMREKMMEGKKLVLSSNSKTFIMNKVCALFRPGCIWVPDGVEEESGRAKYKVRPSEELKEEEKKDSDDNDPRFGDKRVLVITSEYRLKALDVESWATFDMVCYSPTIIAGVSFDLEGVFDSRYGYVSDLSCEATLCVQQLFRVRYPTDSDINLLFNEKCKSAYEEVLDAYGDNLDEYLEKYANLDKDMKVKDERMVEMMDRVRITGFSNYRRVLKLDSVEYKLLKNKLRRYFDSKVNIKGELLRMLEVQGYKYDIPNIDLECDVENMDEEMESAGGCKEVQGMVKLKQRISKKEEIANIRNAGDVFEDEYRLIKRITENTDQSREQVNKINSYNLTRLYGKPQSELSDDEISKGLKYGEFHEIDRFKNENKEPAFELVKRMIRVCERNVDRGERDEKKVHRLVNNRLNKWAKRKMVLDVLEAMGTDHENVDGDMKVEEVSEGFKKICGMIVGDEKTWQLVFNGRVFKKYKEWDEKYKECNETEWDGRKCLQLVNGLLKVVGRKLTSVTRSWRENGVLKKELVGYKMVYLVEEYSKDGILMGNMELNE